MPDSHAWRSVFTGALYELTKVYNWEQVDPGDLTPAQCAALAQDIFFEYLASEGCMIGSIVASLCELPPPHFLPLIGGTYNQADYPRLYDMLADQWSLMAGTFTLPDLRRQTLVQLDEDYPGVTGGLHNFDGLYTFIGAADHVLTVPELAKHNHGMAHTHGHPVHAHTTDPHTHVEGVALPNATTIGPGAPQPTALPGAGVTGVGGGGSTSAVSAGTTNSQSKTVTADTGADTGHNNTQESFVTRFYIVAT